MTNEQAIEILRDTPIDIRSTREDDIYTLYAMAQNMAIEALSNSQKQTESLIRTSADDVSEADVIYRQDAIDAFRKRGDEIIPGGILRGTVYEVLENLPSAEPKTAENGSLDSDMPENKTDRTTGDLISRQDAIDALCKECHNDIPCENYPCGEVESLNNLPSAQRTGEWIDRSEGGRILNPWWESHKCDQCGYFGSGAWNYCPYCGSHNGSEL